MAQITTEELLSEEQWNALGLTENDMLINCQYIEEFGNSNEFSQHKQTLYEKDGCFYQKEQVEKFDGSTETAYYPLNEKDALENVTSFLNDYDVYESQFSCDRNAHFSVKVEITAELMQFVNEDDKSIINRYFPEHTNNKNNTIER